MPVETATYINDLVATNPTAPDGIGQGDDHLRLTKSVLKNSFTAITGAVNATQDDLNGIIGAGNTTTGLLQAPIPSGSTTTGGTLRAKGAGANPNIDFVNLGAAGLSIKVGSTVVATCDASGNWSFTGTVSGSSLKQGANTLLPTGVIMLWGGSVASIPAGWQLADGTNGTMNLRDRFVVGAGSTYAVTAVGGATSVSPTISTDGSHSHGGTTGTAGLHSHNIAIDAQGSHNHAATTGFHTLTISELPAHFHEIATMTNGGGAANPTTVNSQGGSNNGTAQTSSQGGGVAHAHDIGTDGNHAHNGAADSQGNHAHSIGADGSHTHTVTVATLPPYFAVAYIQKV